jgi:hypothetical protein
VPRLEKEIWAELGVFENKARIEVIQLLLNYEIMSLSEICKKLKETYNRNITLPGLLRHMNELETAGIIHQESGGFLQVPDARKRVYVIQGKDRVKQILWSWSELSKKLAASKIFSEVTKTARYVFAAGTIPQPRESQALGSLLEKCESEEIASSLTEDEKKKLKFWKMMLASARDFTEKT